MSAKVSELISTKASPVPDQLTQLAPSPSPQGLAGIPSSLTSSSGPSSEPKPIEDVTVAAIVQAPVAEALASSDSTLSSALVLSSPSEPLSHDAYESKEKGPETLGDLQIALAALETESLSRGVFATRKLMEEANEAFLKRIEASNPVKYREVVEVIKHNLAGSKLQFETAISSWKIAWIARETFSNIPLPDFTSIPEDGFMRTRNQLINTFTPKDCLEPSAETIEHISSRIASICASIKHVFLLGSP